MKRSLLIIFWVLLFLNQAYSQNPISDAAKEMLDGKATKFATKGHPKSKDSAFTIKLPSSWVAKEGERPNIVQKFVSENGTGNAMAIITTSTIPPEESLTEASINEALSSDSLKEMVPEGARFINAQTTKIENEPAGILEYSARMERVGQTLETQTLTLFFFQGRTMVGLQFWLGGQVDSKELRRQFTAYRPLFNMIMNSIVFDDKWAKDDGSTQSTVRQAGETSRDIALIQGLLWYAILTGILWIPALLIRYVVLRRPLQRNYALILTAAIWFVEMVVCLALWNKTPASLHVAAFFSFTTLKASRPFGKQKENLSSTESGSNLDHLSNAYKIIARDGKEYGPVNLETLKRWNSERRIDKETMVFHCERNTWMPIGHAFNYQDWDDSKVQTPNTQSLPQFSEHLRGEKTSQSSAFIVKLPNPSNQTTGDTLKKRSTLAWSNALLILGVFAIASILELWLWSLKRTPQDFSFTELVGAFGGSLPEILGRFIGTLFLGAMGSLLAKRENSWKVFISVSYIAIILSAVGTLSPK